MANRPVYPHALRNEMTEDFFGTSVADPYRWLEDDHDANTVGWLEQQKTLMEAERASWTMRENFAERVEQLLGAGTISPPYARGERTFFMRRNPGQQFPVLYVRNGDDQEQVLIDPMVLDPAGTTTLDAWQPSKEGNLLAYQVSQGGTEESVVYVMDVASGTVIDGPIDRCRFSPIAWLPGEKQFYYVRRVDPVLLPDSEQNFHRRVYLHDVGSSPDTDVLIFGSGMTMTNYYGVEVSRNGRWLQISASEGTEPRNDLWVADLSISSARVPALQLVQGDMDAQTSLSFEPDGRIYVSTDAGAPRGRLAVAEPDDLRTWTDLIPEDAEAVLDGYAVLTGLADGDRLLVARTRHGVSELSLHDARDGGLLHQVQLPGAGTIGGPVQHIDGGPVCWLVYTDHTTVPHVYAFDARVGHLELYASPPGVVDVPPVQSQQVSYTSADGTTVRMFIIAATKTPDRPRPTVLYGYGGFGIPLTPGYSAAILAWVEAGGVWAVANLRGGSEEGEQWHRDGMLGNKQNVYDDFHAAAEYLAQQGWTTPAQLAIYGGSNGGLLVGAAMTQRPELFNAVVCVAPLLDMIRYTTSELGPTWTVEYGDPQVPEEFQWLHAYSPYHRVVEGTDYPATMFVVFDNDTRTDPMHGRKMCAAVQHATIGDRLIVLRTEGDVGHGARSMSKAVTETADTLAFIHAWTAGA